MKTESRTSSNRWTAERANAWFSALPWPVGCNFIPSNAVNQLEMWQANSFDAALIQKELALAAGIGMNTVRVYLHDLAYEQDSDGFLERVNRYLEIASGLGIRTTFVLFDDCWLPNPAIGPQPAPVPGIHNSGWVQSPGLKAASSQKERPRLENYVRTVISAFARDRRVLMWDVYNEIGNIFLLTLARPWYAKWLPLIVKFIRFQTLLPATMKLCYDAFSWTRDIGPDQPLTAGVYFPNRRLNPRLIELSDVITFHNYENADSLQRQIQELKIYGRPLICTEYMARTSGSSIQTHLPIFKRENVGCYNWGLVNGKTQTIYSWDDPGGADRTGIWFHDLFHGDGRPYSDSEIHTLRELTR